MKSMCILLDTAGVLLMVGCCTAPVCCARVGPNPADSRTLASQGQLEVFTSLVEQSDDQNAGSEDPVWYQHADYDIYNLHGQRVKHVDNIIGHYEDAPRKVTLPAGHYVVRAQAKDYHQVKVPVTIEPGRTTRVHLDDTWRPPARTLSRELASLPNGNPVGWRDGFTWEIGLN
jgi:hypothetical protein